MNKDIIPHYELIEAYFENRLNEQEKQQFESQLHANESLQQQLILYKQIVAGIKIAAREKLKMKLSRVDELLQKINLAAEPEEKYGKQKEKEDN